MTTQVASTRAQSILRTANRHFALTLILDLAIAGLLYSFILSQAQQRLQQKEQELSLSLSTDIEAALKLQGMRVGVIASYFSSSEWVSHEEFEQFVSLLFDKNDLNWQRLTWLIHAPAINAEQVQNKLRQNRDKVFRDLEIFDYDHRSREAIKLDPSQGKINVIAYSLPTSNKAFFYGRNIGIKNPLHKNIQRVLDKQTAISSPILSASDDFNRPQLQFFAPIYQAGQIQSSNYDGFIFSSIAIEHIFQQQLANYPADRFSFCLIDFAGNQYWFPDNRINNNSLDKQAASSAYDFDLYGQNWRLYSFDNKPESAFQEPALPVLAVFMFLLPLFISWQVRNTKLRENQLQVLVKQQTLKLEQQNRELELTLQQAQSATKIKSEFLANMSHEIRTPMNGVIGMTSLLKRSELNRKQQGFVEKISLSASHLMAIINDILDFSKLEAGKVELEHCAFSIYQLLNRIHANVQSSCDSKALYLQLKPPENLVPDVKGDFVRICQVVLNLCSNAVKFTKHGGLVISIEQDNIKQHDNGNTYCRLSVKISDTGIGIAEEKIPDLFNEFSQVDNSTTRKYGGTGLGLAISRKLCRAMHGDIAVQSKLGQGSCFTASFEVELDTHIVYDDNNSLQPFAQNKKLLVIDDNQQARAQLAEQLKHWGLAVTHFSAEAVLAEQGQIKLSQYHALIANEHLGHGGLKRLIYRLGFDASQALLVYSRDAESDFTRQMKAYKNIQFLQVATTAATLHHSLTKLFTERATETLPAQTEVAQQRALIVDDNSINQQTLAFMLEDLGIESDSVDNGALALAALKQQGRYDLIFMDCQMPVMDGYETSRQIRKGLAGAHCQNIPIIACTAHALSGDKELCEQAGMDLYLSKPVELKELLELLKQVNS
ncbi:response regulator [Agaribacterium haliotis]|uniref:response regulator n=1 Tax=Agaribacterium haliotis TaxID=2013869 RepID=UPI000BB580AF|nr:response regulator [Agaribacterium haliotis]